MNKSLLAMAAFTAGIILTIGIDTVTDANEPAAEAALFEFGGRSWTRNDISPATAQAFYQLEKEIYERKTELLGKEVVELYLEKYMAENGLSREESIAAVLPAEKITDDQVEAFYKANGHRINAAYDAVKVQIGEYLSYQHTKQAENKLVEQLSHDGQFALKLNAPTLPMNVINYEGFPAKGSDDPVVTLVKFADYQCPHCKRAAETLDKLMAEHGDKIRLVYIDFPVNRSGISRTIAEAAVCVDEQDKFWSYNQQVFAQQDTLTAESAMLLAKEVGIEMEPFNQCMASNRPKDKVRQAEAEAERLGLTGTPSFFANGKRLTPENLEAGLQQAVEALLD